MTICIHLLQKKSVLQNMQELFSLNNVNCLLMVLINFRDSCKVNLYQKHAEASINDVISALSFSCRNWRHLMLWWEQVVMCTCVLFKDLLFVYTGNTSV